MTRNQQHLLSKIATGNGHGENSPYFDGWKPFEDNPLHHTKNPNGVFLNGPSRKSGNANLRLQIT